MLTAKITIMPKPGILDPQGQVVHQSLESMGFQGIDDLRIGKMIILKLNHTDKKEAEMTVRAMCEKLLVNPNTESFTVTIE